MTSRQRQKPRLVTSTWKQPRRRPINIRTWLSLRALSHIDACHRLPSPKTAAYFGAASLTSARVPPASSHPTSTRSTPGPPRSSSPIHSCTSTPSSSSSYDP
eukprot:scaffold33987_cov124-Isochrysis_galbana.AAC.3